MGSDGSSPLSSSSTSSRPTTADPTSPLAPPPPPPLRLRSSSSASSSATSAYPVGFGMSVALRQFVEACTKEAGQRKEGELATIKGFL